MVHSFRKLFTVFSIIGLFVFAAISFIDSLQTENNASSSILENELINRTFSSLSEDISDQQTTTNSSKNAFESEIPAPGFGSLIIFAIVGVTHTFTSILTGTYNLIIVLPLVTLGIPSPVANILGSILMITLTLFAWRVYRVGS